MAAKKPKEPKEPQTEPLTADAPAAEETPAAEPAPEENKAAALEAELAAAKEAHIRTLAEYDNYRKRSTREQQALYGDAKADALTQLLPVLDNFVQRFPLIFARTSSSLGCGLDFKRE